MDIIKSSPHPVKGFFMSRRKGSELRRFHFTVPDNLYSEMENAANEEGITVTDLIRGGIKLRLVLHEVSKSPDAAIIIREQGTEREIFAL